jgi:hypothetical protein
MAELTNAQEEYFRILQSLDTRDGLKRVIADAKDDLRHSNDHLVRGVTRVQGFRPNPSEKN